MQTKRKAFTLIEMAVVLVIIGFILATTMPLLTERIGKDQITKGRRTVSSLKKEIIGYALQNDHLPKLERSGATDSFTRVEEMSGARDPWQSRVAYWSDPDITYDGTTTPSICTQGSSAPGNLRLTDTQAGQTYSDVAFIIASRGANFNLQVGDNGATSPKILTTYAPGFDDSNFNDFDHTTTLGADYDVAGAREEDFDDLVEYVSYSYLYSELAGIGLCDASGPTGADTSFATEPDAYDPTTAATSVDSEGRPSISKSPDGEIELQTSSGSSNGYGCLWYTGTTAGCSADPAGTNGVCSAPSGIRAYFTFNSKAGSDGGWTFAIIGVNATQSINNYGDVANDYDLLCGGECGNNGYADTYGGTLGLAPPKIGIEFDYYRAVGNNFEDDQLGQTTGNGGYSSNNDYGAVSIVYWGDDATLLDDVEHVTNVSSANDYGNYQADNSADNTGLAGGDYFQPGGIAGASPYNIDKWLDDGKNHQVRIEIHRNDASNNDMDVYVWFDCTAANCRNLAADYNPPVPSTEYGFQIKRELTSNVPLFSELTAIRFGWTFGDCGGSSGHDTTISDFGLAFR